MRKRSRRKKRKETAATCSSSPTSTPRRSASAAAAVPSRPATSPRLGRDLHRRTWAHARALSARTYLRQVLGVADDLLPLLPPLRTAAAGAAAFEPFYHSAEEGRLGDGVVEAGARVRAAEAERGRLVEGEVERRRRRERREERERTRSVSFPLSSSPSPGEEDGDGDGDEDEDENGGEGAALSPKRSRGDYAGAAPRGWEMEGVEMGYESSGGWADGR